MKKVVFTFGMLIVLLGTLNGCENATNTSSEEKIKLTSTGAAVEAVVSDGDVYVKKTKDKREGVYISESEAKEDPTVEASTLYIHRVTDMGIWLSYDPRDSYPYIDKVFAEKDAKTNNYCFDFYNNSENGMEKWTGELVGEGEEYELSLELKTVDGKKYDEDNEDGYLYDIYTQQKRDEDDTILEMSHCFQKTYKEIRESIYKKNLYCLELGKERNKDSVSYIEVNIDKLPYSFWEELRYYQLCDVGVFATKEECKQKMGKPLKETDSKWVYAGQDGYEVCFTFSENYISKMGIYKGTEQEAKKEYTEGDFTLVGSRIVKWNKPFQKGGKIELPEDAVAIGEYVISSSGTPEVLSEDYGEEEEEEEESVSYTKEEVELFVSKDVYLEPGVFGEPPVKSLKVTFEEGRTEIEPYLMRNMVYSGEGITVILPKSIKVIRKEAFYVGTYSDLKIVLNDGIEEIQERGLMAYKGSLPASLKKIQEKGLYFWEPVCDEDYTLPKGLEEIGNYGINIKDRSDTLTLPKTLKKLGYGSLGDYDGDNNCKLDEGNEYFVLDKHGDLYSRDFKILYATSTFMDDHEKSKECIQIMTPYHFCTDEELELWWKYYDCDDSSDD